MNLPASFLKEHKDVIILVDDEAGIHLKETDYEQM